MADDTLSEGKEDDKQDPVVKLNFAKNRKEPVKEEAQEASPEDDKPRDGDGDIFEWEMELSGVAGILDFMEEVFNVVGDGSLEFTTSYGYAVGDLMRLCAKRLRLIQP